MPPPVAVTVMAWGPVGVVLLVEIFSVEARAGAPEEGLKLAVAPEGRPEADKLTVSTKPPTGVIEMIAVTDSPWRTNPEVGLTRITKSGVAGLRLMISFSIMPGSPMSQGAVGNSYGLSSEGQFVQYLVWKAYHLGE